MDVTQLLSASVAPVVLISACGLITLALYNRLGAILGRLRTCHERQFQLLKEIDVAESSLARSQLEVVESQIEKVTSKARMVQKGLFCLLASVVAFLSCSFFSALGVWSADFGVVAVIVYFLGLLLFAAGIGWAIRELTMSITPLDEVNLFLEVATAQHVLMLGARKPMPREVAESA